ncbi:6387_t:CDS:2, partial [Rhizophagus irregularis]
METTTELSEYHVEILKDFLNDFQLSSTFSSTNNVSEKFKYQQLILKRLSIITNALRSCYQEDFRIANNECAIKFCKLLSKNQLILAQYLIHNDNFIVYLTKKLLTLWLLLISNEKPIVDNINIEETQRQLLKKICDLYNDKLKDMSSSATIESVLEIFHCILKDFRHCLSEVIDEDAENILSQHAGCRLLNVLNEQFKVEQITNIADTSNNLIIVPILTVILDIKKLEIYEIEVALDSYLVKIFQSFLEKVDSKIESICVLLCCGYLPAIRKVLNILYQTVKSTSNIDMIFTILTSIRDYTGQILAASDVQKLNGCPTLDNDYTEFFDRQKDNNKVVSNVSINIECTKKLIDIYMEVYTNIMKLLMENNINMIGINISADIKLRILTNILSFSHVEYLFNWYTNNDSDLTFFMLNFVRLELTFREFKKKLINFDGESQKRTIKSVMESVSLQMNHILNHFTSHDFFLRFLISTGFNHSILLDFIISNETNFLEFLLKYCKYLEQDISQFFIICKKFDKKNSEMENCAEQVLRVFNCLIQSIQSLMEKKLFPYNATSLIKRLKKVELCLKE